MLNRMRSLYKIPILLLMFVAGFVGRGNAQADSLVEDPVTGQYVLMTEELKEKLALIKLYGTLKTELDSLCKVQPRSLRKQPFLEMLQEFRQSNAKKAWHNYNLVSRIIDELVEVYYDERNVDSAMYFNSLSDSVYHTESGDCLNGMMMGWGINACMYAKIFMLKGDTTSAINALLREALNWESRAPVKMLGQLWAQYDGVQLLAQADSSIRDVSPTNIYTMHFNGSCFWSIYFQGRNLNSYFPVDEGEKVEDVRMWLWHSDFYQMLICLAEEQRYRKENATHH